MENLNCQDMDDNVTLICLRSKKLTRNDMQMIAIFNREGNEMNKQSLVRDNNPRKQHINVNAQRVRAKSPRMNHINVDLSAFREIQIHQRCYSPD